MRPSVIQLRQLVFKGIHLEPVESGEADAPGDITHFDFEPWTFATTSLPKRIAKTLLSPRIRVSRPRLGH